MPKARDDGGGKSLVEEVTESIVAAEIDANFPSDGSAFRKKLEWIGEIVAAAFPGMITSVIVVDVGCDAPFCRFVTNADEEFFVKILEGMVGDLRRRLSDQEGG